MIRPRVVHGSLFWTRLSNCLPDPTSECSKNLSRRDLLKIINIKPTYTNNDNYHTSTKSWPNRKKTQKLGLDPWVHPSLDNSDKPSYGFTCGSLSNRASVTWIRPVTDHSWPDLWFQKLREDKHGMMVQPPSYYVIFCFSNSLDSN